MWSPASAQRISSWEKWIADDAAGSTRNKIPDAASALPGEAFCADPHASVRTGPVRRNQRRVDRGNCAAVGFEGHPGRRDAGLLLDATSQADGQATRTGMHEHFLHAAWWQPASRTRRAQARDRQ